jgi:hypothetical protein
VATVVVVTVLLLPFSWLLGEGDFSDSYWRFWFGNYPCLPGLLPAHGLLSRFNERVEMWGAAGITIVGFLVVVMIGRIGRWPLVGVSMALLALMVVLGLASRAAYLM